MERAGKSFFQSVAYFLSEIGTGRDSRKRDGNQNKRYTEINKYKWEYNGNREAETYTGTTLYRKHTPARH